MYHLGYTLSDPLYVQAGQNCYCYCHAASSLCHFFLKHFNVNHGFWFFRQAFTGVNAPKAVFRITSVAARLGISGFLILGTFRISASRKLAVTSLSSQSFRMAFSVNPRLSLPLLITESPENYKHTILFLKIFNFQVSIKSSDVANTQFPRKKRKHSTL